VSETIGRFRLLREIGGRAGTWAARRVSDMELVTVHRVPAAGRAPTILSEARRALDIEHPCVVRVRAVEAASTDVLISTDFHDGETYDMLLEASRQRREPISLAVTLRILCDVLGALAAMHDTLGTSGRRVQIVYGRFAPFDVHVGLDGLARVVLGARWSRAPDRILGYVAPEIILRGDEDADERSDVYAVGVMLWEALAGQRLYDVTTPEALLGRQMRGQVLSPPVPPSAPWAGPIGALAVRALAGDPKDRFVSATAMLEALLEVAGRRIGAANDVASTVETTVGPFSRARRRELAALSVTTAVPRASGRDGDERTLAIEGDELKTEIDLDADHVQEVLRGLRASGQLESADATAQKSAEVDVASPTAPPAGSLTASPIAQPRPDIELPRRAVPRPSPRALDAAPEREPVGTSTLIGMAGSPLPPRPPRGSVVGEETLDYTGASVLPSQASTAAPVRPAEGELYDVETATLSRSLLAPFLVDQTVRMPKPNDVNRPLPGESASPTSPFAAPPPRPPFVHDGPAPPLDPALAAGRGVHVTEARPWSQTAFGQGPSSSPSPSVPSSVLVRAALPVSSGSGPSTAFSATDPVRRRGRDRSSLLLGLVTFVVVLALLGAATWFTFPIWRHWARI
jgi:eukaryotic-like serine/threonine-protein kinase